MTSEPKVMAFIVMLSLFFSLSRCQYTHVWIAAAESQADQ